MSEPDFLMGGPTFRLYRETMGLEARDCASLLGVNVRTLYRWGPEDFGLPLDAQVWMSERWTGWIDKIDRFLEEVEDYAEGTEIRLVTYRDQESLTAAGSPDTLEETHATNRALAAIFALEGLTPLAAPTWPVGEGVQEDEAHWGPSFRLYRETMGLESRDVSDFLGVNPRTITRWEAGRFPLAIFARDWILTRWEAWITRLGDYVDAVSDAPDGAEIEIHTYASEASLARAGADMTLGEVDAVNRALAVSLALADFVPVARLVPEER